jgi:hypothetical protein
VRSSLATTTTTGGWTGTGVVKPQEKVPCLPFEEPALEQQDSGGDGTGTLNMIGFRFPGRRRQLGSAVVVTTVAVPLLRFRLHFRPLHLEMVNNWVQVQENAAVLLLFTDGNRGRVSGCIDVEVGVETSLRWGDSCTSSRINAKALRRY